MKKWLNRVIGVLLIASVIVGLVISISGLTFVWRMKPGIAQKINDAVEVLNRALNTTSDLLVLVDNSLKQASDSVDQIDKVVQDADSTLNNISPTISNISDFVGKDFVKIITDTQTTLVSTKNTAGLIDETLKTISSLMSLNPFASAPTYAPQVPLQKSIEQMSQNLDSLPSSLNQIQSDLKTTAVNLNSIQSSLEKLSGNIKGIKSSITQAKVVLLSYKQIIDEMTASVVSLQSQLLEWLNLATWGITIILIWVMIAQITPLAYGIEVFFRNQNHVSKPLPAAEIESNGIQEK